MTLTTLTHTPMDKAGGRALQKRYKDIDREFDVVIRALDRLKKKESLKDKELVSTVRYEMAPGDDISDLFVGNVQE